MGDDRLAEWVFGAQFSRYGGVEQIISADAGHGCDFLHLGAAEGERTGLVEHHGIDLAQGLKVNASLDDGAKAGGTADATENSKWRAGGDTTSAGDDDHRDRGIDVASDQEGRDGGA